MTKNLLDRSLKALSSLTSYAKWQISEGDTHHPTLPSALAQAESVLFDAKEPEVKSTTTVMIDDQEYEIEGCPFCGSAPEFVERAGDAFGFRCTCASKRYIQTYYDTSINDRTGRIESAVASWNNRS
ncbi:Lar family restriction alleviation protein [Sulfitobacter sp. R18_1]|uniref:Lar family restriction alleviation protein n=1 Tax=Sulfitobacter sp. R18_1 TaxID=2821104 RepID=UPI001ADB29E3|nr:Lar family restriction alleviation protein [Sulfitobacter sp. R18_1]MBO9427935.1 Lar family restriction alleviation protein [Sulfitobacter sp. R18_1]